ncbi:unnamed protein product [Prorocentrum cordatum]|uniref:Uncharacterized protein n=1 Tax=Prorocentrum cordatum TaxID=2364126 RepID=A0ABN9YGG6_9DINO|nr:unnamed protein product [Polarella glacialis]
MMFRSSPLWVGVPDRPRSITGSSTLQTFRVRTWCWSATSKSLGPTSRSTVLPSVWIAASRGTPRKVKVDATPCGNVKIDKNRDELGECDYKNEGRVEVIIVHGGKKMGVQDEGEEAGRGDSDPGSRGKDRKAAASADSQPAGAGAAAGGRVRVRKAAVGGWATISFQDADVRRALLREHEHIVVQSGVEVKLQPQIDQATKEEVPADIFASWGRKAEEKSPVAERELLRCFEALAAQAEAALARAAPSRAAGRRVQVRKAAVGGCAVVAFQDAALRAAVLQRLDGQLTWGPGWSPRRSRRGTRRPRRRCPRSSSSPGAARPRRNLPSTRRSSSASSRIELCDSLEAPSGVGAASGGAGRAGDEVSPGPAAEAER